MSEIDEIMEDYMERKEEQEKQFEKVSAENQDKAEKDGASAADARNRAMERLSETKRRGDDPPKKKRKSSFNDPIPYLQEKAEKDYEIQKQELELRKNMMKVCCSRVT